MKNSVARIGEIANHVIEDCNDRSKLLATKVPTKLSEWRTEQENFLKVKQDLTEKVGFCSVESLAKGDRKLQFLVWKKSK